MRIELDEGKYIYYFTDDGKQLIYRNGDLWRNETGDNLIYFMACKINELQEALEEVEDIIDKLSDVLPCDINEIIED